MVFRTSSSRLRKAIRFFLSEIIRKLVLDQKLRLEGQRWVLEATEQGYLPRSLEEIRDTEARRAR